MTEAGMKTLTQRALELVERLSDLSEPEAMAVARIAMEILTCSASLSNDATKISAMQMIGTAFGDLQARNPDMVQIQHQPKTKEKATAPDWVKDETGAGDDVCGEGEGAQA